jgi:hypothetical protein
MPTLGEFQSATIGIAHPTAVGGNLVGAGEYAAHAAEHAAMGVAMGGSRRLFPAVIDVTRNSTNTSADTSETALATYTIPPNIGLVPGSVFNVIAVFENSNSATSKSLICRVNGSSAASIGMTTNQLMWSNTQLEVYDANTLLILPNFQASFGASAALATPMTVSNIDAIGFTITLTAKWAAQVAGEFIRLKYSRVSLQV